VLTLRPRVAFRHKGLRKSTTTSGRDRLSFHIEKAISKNLHFAYSSPRFERKFGQSLIDSWRLCRPRTNRRNRTKLGASRFTGWMLVTSKQKRAKSLARSS